MKQKIKHKIKSLLGMQVTSNKKTTKKVPKKRKLSPVMNSELASKIQNSITLSFVGDLILLEDQVKRAYNGEKKRYEFDEVFEYTSKYFKNSDYTVGVLELPLVDAKAGYSSSNFRDGIPLRLAAPDEWAKSIQKAGIDLVSTSNNHALDKGEEALIRTMDVLDDIGLDYVGTYRNPEERERVFIKEIQGLKIAFIAYTYGLNACGRAHMNEENSHLLNFLSKKDDGKLFNLSKERILKDVENAKKEKVDLIIALPHMGTQFLHKSTEYTRLWADVFFEAGVDIILACHSHAVQPIEYRKIIKDGKEKTGVIAYCPGNFVNSYVDKNGDATSIINIHLSRSGDVVASSVVPMWTYSGLKSQWIAMPIYDILTNDTMSSKISRDDFKRIGEVQKIITKVMVGEKLTLNQAQDRYYYFPDLGYVRNKIFARLKTEVDANKLDPDRKKLYNLFNKSNTVVFVGDSITEGTKNGGYGWFEPLNVVFPNKQFIKKGLGSVTTKRLLNESENFLNEDGDLFVIALGTNDVRYRNELICSMTAEDYISDLEKIVFKIKERNPNAKIAFINAWLAFYNDKPSKLKVKDRDAMLAEYNKKLEEFAEGNDHIYINANDSIKDFLKNHVTKDYIIDSIHPNANHGTKLYSNAVMFGDSKNWLIE